MNEGHAERMIQLQAATVAVLDRIARSLEAIALTKAPAPNFVRPIAEFAEFDFDSIGAKVTTRDTHGPTALEWGRYSWTRRSPSNKFGEAIWFSRAVGKDDTGVKYARLITFKIASEAEPLPAKVAAKVETQKPAAVSNTNATTSAPSAPNGNGSQPKAITYEPVASEVAETVEWPATREAFDAWAAQYRITGAQLYKALGCDSKTWFRINIGKGYADLAQTLVATLGLMKA